MSLLEESGVEFTIVEYLKNPLNRDEILSLSSKLGMAPGGFVRKNESSYKENNFGEILNDNKAMEVQSINLKIFYLLIKFQNFQILNLINAEDLLA